MVISSLTYIALFFLPQSSLQVCLLIRKQEALHSIMTQMENPFQQSYSTSCLACSLSLFPSISHHRTLTLRPCTVNYSCLQQLLLSKSNAKNVLWAELLKIQICTTLLFLLMCCVQKKRKKVSDQIFSRCFTLLL